MNVIQFFAIHHILKWKKIKGICLIAEWSLVLQALVTFKGSAALSLIENGIL